MSHNPVLVSAGILVILCLIPMSQPRAQDQAGIAARKDVLELKARKRIEAEYPQEAKKHAVSGIVLVEIVIDQKGKVTLPRAVMGHPVLRPAALEAAKGWEFEMPMLSGQPTKVLGAILFCFQVTKDRSKSKLGAFERCCPERARKADDWCADNN